LRATKAEANKSRKVTKCIYNNKRRISWLQFPTIDRSPLSSQANQNCKFDAASTYLLCKLPAITISGLTPVTTIREVSQPKKKCEYKKKMELKQKKPFINWKSIYWVFSLTEKLIHEKELN